MSRMHRILHDIFFMYVLCEGTDMCGWYMYSAMLIPRQLRFSL